MNPKISRAIAVLIIILAVGAGAWAGARLWHRRAVRSAIPKYVAALAAQRDSLSQAIEAYHAHFGFYPPNQATNQPNRASLNPLFYELVGTRWNTNYESFGLPTTKTTIKPDTMLRLFNMRSFSNSLPYPTWPTNFLEKLNFVGQEEDDVILVGSPAPEGIGDAFLDEFSTSSWRYVADPAEHKGGKFDLWIELRVLGERHVIANWE